MGTESLWIPAALAAVGAGTSYYNTKQTQDKQDSILAQQLRQQSARQSEADSAVNKLISDRAASDSSAERGTTAAQYLDQVRAAQTASTAGLGQVGAVSDAYKTAANDAALGISDYGTQTANLMSRIDAPKQQRQREALENAQLQTNLGLIGGRAADDDYLAQLKLQGVKSNPWLSAASQLATGAAMGMAASGLGSASGSTLGAQANGITQANNANLFSKLQAGWGY